MNTLLLISVSIVLVASGECRYQRQYQFQQRSDRSYVLKRSDYKPCTKEEEQKLKILAEKQFNVNIRQENREMNFLMPMPELEQKPIRLGTVKSCTKAELKDGGYSFKMTAEGVQNGEKVDCSIEGIHDSQNGIQIDENQCQGMD